MAAQIDIDRVLALSAVWWPWYARLIQGQVLVLCESLIGLGAQPPTPKWGAMIADAQSYVRSAWRVAAFPGLAITLTVIGFNLLADVLQDLLDPRARA